MSFIRLSGAAVQRCLSIFAVAISLTSLPVFASSSPLSLSLAKATAITLANNPQLHQFEPKNDALVGQRENSELGPQINTDIELENFAGSGNFSSTQNAELTLALSSVIELGSKRGARTMLADTKLQALEYRRQAATLDVLGSLTRDFIQALAIQEYISLAEEARDLAANTLAALENRAKQGAAPDYEVRRARAALAQAKLRLNSLRREHQRGLVKLAAYWGETAPKWTVLEGDLYQFREVVSYEELYREAQSSPAITVLASEARTRDAELALLKTQSIPDINWQLGVRQFENSDDTAFVAGLSIPLFSGTRNTGAVKAARAAQNEVVFEQASALLKMHVQLFEAYSQRAQHLAAVNAYRNTILPELSASLRATQQAYEAGRYSYIELIAVQRELLNAKQALIENAAAASLNQSTIEQLVAKPLTPRK
ncbi:TolC family protein [Zhongshania marina]|uniref:TolC family protein n=1 Tax=Zhongshania marina TaxID=2304603 RepID=A0ABX9WA30_9GAMM|nr:TolC family protein [Zhongshania marina]